MPIIKANNKLVFFAHVPKCGGTTIQSRLLKNDIHLSYYINPPARLQSHKVIPQHTLAHDIAILFNDGFFDNYFAVIRDPVKRFLSAYAYNKHHGLNEGFDQFLQLLKTDFAQNGTHLQNRFINNHFSPMAHLIPEGSKIFHLEDGLDAVFEWIQQELDLPNLKTLEPQNLGDYTTKYSYEYRTLLGKILRKPLKEKQELPPQYDDLDKAQIKLIRSLYKEDYQRFYK